MVAGTEDLYDLLDVVMFKKPDKGLGLSIVGRKSGPGVFISEVVEGGVASADGRLQKVCELFSLFLSVIN